MNPVSLLRGIFGALVVCVSTLDLFLIIRRHSAVGVKNALLWTLTHE